ncbi:HCLS1-associated protein X-1 isoform X1 [Tachysurus fulvidraco]|uniref:HCLS1-associated protein X-1 isoform X1 n=1 Tax=Tachysurus fulvidraco TaxID=1234273 RepID=UPI000F4E99F9|nr:HCLS1-associated protein X-1 isoform X1 [Tachysurus fulvidraco]
MSVFDLFRGFFGVPGGRNRGGDQREPFFEWLTHEDDDDDDDEVEDGFHHEYFDDGLRFDFSFGPNRMRIQQPQLFEQIFQEMEDMFASLGSFRHDLPSVEAPPQRRPADEGSRRAGRRENSLRDFMLKHPDDYAHNSHSVAPRDVCPSSPGGPSAPRSPFHHWTPFSRFRDVWSDGTRPKEEEKKVDGDLDSQVSSGGLEHILTPAPSQPNTRSSFKSVTVMKVVKPDGTVEERRTVRDGLGNEETTVIRSGPGAQEGPHDDASPSAGAPEPFSDMQDDFSIFSKFFGGFRR